MSYVRRQFKSSGLKKKKKSGLNPPNRALLSVYVFFPWYFFRSCFESYQKVKGKKKKKKNSFYSLVRDEMMEVSRPDWGHTSPDKTEKRMDQCLGGDGILSFPTP